MSKLGEVFSKVVLPNRITDGGIGEKSPEAGHFLKKQAILMPLEYIPHVSQNYLKEPGF